LVTLLVGGISLVPAVLLLRSPLACWAARGWLVGMTLPLLAVVVAEATYRLW